MIAKQLTPRGEHAYYTSHAGPDDRSLNRTEWNVCFTPNTQTLVKHLDIDLPAALDSINSFLVTLRTINSGRVDLDELILERVVKKQSKISHTASGIDEITSDSIHFCPGM